MTKSKVRFWMIMQAAFAGLNAIFWSNPPNAFICGLCAAGALFALIELRSAA